MLSAEGRPRVYPQRRWRWGALSQPSAPCRQSRRAGRGVPRPRGRVPAAFLLRAVPPCGLPLGAGREVRTLSRRHALPHPGKPEHVLDRGRGRGVPGSRSRRVDERPSPFPTRPAGTRGAGAARRVFTDSRAEISPRICGGSLVTAAKPPPALHFRTLSSFQYSYPEFSLNEALKKKIEFPVFI